MERVLPMATVSTSGIPWRAVWILSISSNISWGSIYYAFSVLQIPMEQELGWSKAALTLGPSLGLAIAAIAIVPVGCWIDRSGGRVVMGAGSFLAASTLAAWSSVHTLPMYYMVWIVMGLVMSMVLYEATFSVLTAACEGSAHKAIVFVTLAGGLASTVFYPLVHFLTETLSWRIGLVVLALLNLGICFPLHAFGLPRHRTEPPLSHETLVSDTGGRIDGQAVSGIRDALVNPAFWLVALAFSASTLILSAMATHLIPLLLEKGLTLTDAVVVAASVGPMQVLGRLLQLLRNQWLTPVRLGILTFALFPLALSILALASPDSMLLFVFAGLYGVANGMVTILRGTAIPTLFGRHNFGRLNGLLAAPSLLARAAGPIVASLLWTAFDGYDLLLWSFVTIGTVATAIYWWGIRNSPPSDEARTTKTQRL